MTPATKIKLKQSIKAKLIAYAKLRGISLLEAGNKALDIVLSFERGIISKLEFQQMLKELNPVKLNKAQIYYYKHKKRLNAHRVLKRRLRKAA